MRGVAAIGSVLSLLVWIGCADPNYGSSAAGGAAARIGPKGNWAASGTVPAAQLAVDGDKQTVAKAGTNRTDAMLQIDLGEISLFNMVVIDHGEEEMGFGRQVAVETSLDGRSWERVLTAPGKRKVTVLNMIRPQLARYVRLTVLEPGERPWAVAEVHLQ